MYMYHMYIYIYGPCAIHGCQGSLLVFSNVPFLKQFYGGCLKRPICQNWESFVSLSNSCENPSPHNAKGNLKPCTLTCIQESWKPLTVKANHPQALNPHSSPCDTT